jgi:prepilin-type processing-associated H-X9-DG protein
VSGLRPFSYFFDFRLSRHERQANLSLFDGHDLEFRRMLDLALLDGEGATTEPSEIAVDAHVKLFSGCHHEIPLSTLEDHIDFRRIDPGDTETVGQVIDHDRKSLRTSIEDRTRHRMQPEPGGHGTSKQALSPMTTRRQEASLEPVLAAATGRSPQESIDSFA